MRRHVIELARRTALVFSLEGRPWPVAYREARTLVYVRTPQSVMKIRLISLDERHEITDKFKEFFQEPKRNLSSQFY